MKRLIWYLRMAIFVQTLYLLMKLVPNSAIRTLVWLSHMPRDEWEDYQEDQHGIE